MNENEPIRIGRINRAVERALEISLSGDVNIYMSEEDVNAIAAKRPDSYLAYVEELSQILEKPDFVSFDLDRQAFFFCRAYAQDHAFHLVFLEVHKVGNLYYLTRTFKGGRMPLLPEVARLDFARPLEREKKVSEPSGTS